jgi:hypothetical protein
METLLKENQRLAKLFREAYIENEKKWRDRDHDLSSFERGQYGGMAIAYRRAHEEIIFALRINQIVETERKKYEEYS